MNYRYLGRTGPRVSEISLGTQTFGWTTGETDAHAMLDRYIERGGTISIRPIPTTEASPNASSVHGWPRAATTKT